MTDAAPHSSIDAGRTTQFPSERDRLKSLAAVVVAAFGIGMSFGVGFPLTALTLEMWHTPYWLIGIAGTAPSLAVLLALPFMPSVVARWGLARAIITGCLTGALGFVALAVFRDAYAWIAIRFLMSLGLALPWLAGETWINLVTREETRGRVIALYAISFFLGYSAGPLVLELVGLEGIWPCVAGATSMALAGLPILLAARLAPSVTDEGHSTNVLAALALAPAGMIGGFIGGFSEMSYFSLLGNVSLAGGRDQGEALRLMSAMTMGGVALQFLIGWLADKASRARITIALGAAFIALSLALPFVITRGDLAYAHVFVLGGVILGFYTIGLVIVGQVAPRDLAAANAAFLIMYNLGAIVGPAAAGMAMSVSPISGFVTVMAGTMVLAILVLVMATRRAAVR